MKPLVDKLDKRRQELSELIEDSKLADLEELQRGEITQSQYEARQKNRRNQLKTILIGTKEELEVLANSLKAEPSQWFTQVPVLLAITGIVTLLEIALHHADSLSPILEQIVEAIGDLLTNISDSLA